MHFPIVSINLLALSIELVTSGLGVFQGCFLPKGCWFSVSLFLSLTLKSMGTSVYVCIETRLRSNELERMLCYV